VKIKPVTTFTLLLLAFLVGLCFAWTIHPNNYFIFDDYGHFMLVNRPDFLSNYSLLPRHMYNDRPIAEFAVWGLWHLFKFNPVPSHLIFVLLHLVNSYLVFFFAKKLNYSAQQAAAAAFLFALWPKSTHAVRWIAAIFDLLGATLTLITVHVAWYGQNEQSGKEKKSSWKTVLLGLVFFVALRTKESVLTLPACIAILGWINQQRTVFKHGIFLGLISLSYLSLLVWLAVKTQFMGLNTPGAPYEVSFAPLTLISNAAKYLVLFFSLPNQPILFNREFLWPILGVLCIGFISVVSWLKHREVKPLMLLVCSVIAFGPLLPLINMQHKLYLYIPSIFFFLALAWYVDSGKKLFLLLVGLLYLNFFETNYWFEKKWWWEIGNQNQHTFQLISKLPQPAEGSKIAIFNNQNPASIFQYGPGNVLQLYFKDPSLKIEDSSNATAPTNISYAINYNSGSIRFVGNDTRTAVCGLEKKL
jgi:hypothetical protein